MAKGNGHDHGTARAQLARRLMQLAPRQRLDALIEGADARGLVRAVPAEDLYLAIAEVGLADAVEVVQLASPEQFRTCVDLAAWKANALAPLQVLAWLRAARGEDTGDFLRKVHFIDQEVLEIVLRSLTVMHDLEENPDVNPPGVTMETPEGRYLIELKAEGLDLVALKGLVSDLVAENPLEATRLFEAVRWEMPSELEEIALHFRSGRLADLGFPDPAEAAELFTYVDPEKLAPAPRPAPGPALEAARRVDFVEAAFQGLDSGEAEALTQELRYLVNSALVAERAEPGDPAALRWVTELTRDYLSLGLEHLSGGDSEFATDAIREHPAKKCFQVGFSLTVTLKRQADRLGHVKGARHGAVWWALDDEAAALEALQRPRPMKAVKVEGADPVPFRTRRELAEARQLLGRVERQREVFAALSGGDWEAVLARFGGVLTPGAPERLFLAAAAWALLDGEPRLSPVPEGRLVELFERLFEGDAAAPKLRPAALERSAKAIAARVGAEAQPEAGLMVARVFERLLAELGPAYLAEGRVDPKTILSLPVAGQAFL